MMETIKENERYSHRKTGSKSNENRYKVKKKLLDGNQQIHLKRHAPFKNSKLRTMDCNQMDNSTTVNNCGILVINNFDKSYINSEQSVDPNHDRENANKSQLYKKIFNIDAQNKVRNIESAEISKRQISHQKRSEDSTNHNISKDHQKYRMIDCMTIDRDLTDKKTSKSLEHRRKRRKLDMLRRQHHVMAKQTTLKSVQQIMLQNEMKKSKEFKALFDKDGGKRDYLGKSKVRGSNSRSNDLGGNTKSSHNMSQKKLNSCNKQDNSHKSHRITLKPSKVSYDASKLVKVVEGSYRHEYDKSDLSESKSDLVNSDVIYQ